MRYEHERLSVGPLPASDMRARICYRGAGPPNTACLPGRERGLTGGRRAANSPPDPRRPPPPRRRCPAKGTLDKQHSPLTSFHTDLIELLGFSVNGAAEIRFWLGMRCAARCYGLFSDSFAH